MCVAGDHPACSSCCRRTTSRALEESNPPRAGNAVRASGQQHPVIAANAPAARQNSWPKLPWMPQPMDNANPVQEEHRGRGAQGTCQDVTQWSPRRNQRLPATAECLPDSGSRDEEPHPPNLAPQSRIAGSIIDGRAGVVRTNSISVSAMRVRSFFRRSPVNGQLIVSKVVLVVHGMTLTVHSCDPDPIPHPTPPPSSHISSTFIRIYSGVPVTTPALTLAPPTGPPRHWRSPPPRQRPHSPPPARIEAGPVPPGPNAPSGPGDWLQPDPPGATPFGDQLIRHRPKNEVERKKGLQAGSGRR